MPAVNVLPPAFYARPAVLVARSILGMRLVRWVEGERVGGIITEAEAYQGEDDLACHARAGRTPRTEMLYASPGTAYVYFTYGMHWMLNVVCDRLNYPAAVLIRAIQPIEGLEQIAARRPAVPEKQWCNGPAKLTRALGVERPFNGCNLTDQGSGLWIEEGEPFADAQVRITPRIGIEPTPEPWLSKPWRFVVVQPNRLRTDDPKG